MRRVGVDETARRTAVRELCGTRHLLAVGIDGPLTTGLRITKTYRSAETFLSRGMFQKRGKPGQTSSRVGQTLHQHATQFATIALQESSILGATHPERIHDLAVVEAFPNAFLGALIPEAHLPTLERNASDRYWDTCVALGLLELLPATLLPGRTLSQSLSAITNHDDRAGVVCALTALSIACDAYAAVGDAHDGWIILPPRESWGSDDGMEPWVLRELRQNAVRRLDEHQRGRAPFPDTPSFNMHPLSS